MSWGVSASDKLEEVKASVAKQFDSAAGYYPPGTGEGDEVAAVRSLVEKALDRVDMSASDAYGDEVLVSANGSNSWSRDKEKPLAASASFSVSRGSKGA